MHKTSTNGVSLPLVWGAPGRAWLIVSALIARSAVPVGTYRGAGRRRPVPTDTPIAPPLGFSLSACATCRSSALRSVAGGVRCPPRHYHAQRSDQVAVVDGGGPQMHGSTSADASALECRTWRKNRPPKGKGRPVWFGSLDKDWVPSMSGGSMTANQFEQGIATFPEADLSYSSEI